MQQGTWVQLVHSRGTDAHAVILPYVASVLAIFAFIIWGGDALDAGAVQLAIAAWIVLGSLWTMLWFDGVIADLAAAMKDMEPDVAGSHIGQNFAKAPFPLFRGFNALVIVAMAVLQLVALYS
ncbi:MAG: hypothetical protein VX971_04930 [Actinomycetota bacterium]|jgi:hypothetical protein|nr:hypothetical protein [Acidimicrobiaceae bacterium]MCH2624849.1 hypothetical protein [Acidimicrobiales bacterium]MEC8922979.1 hypothetical protein [Actinomycetota bacterium]MCS5683466.1 hypothetical protein [Acidimicrobiales bacterium]MEC9269716.1 hypothetical protein [Actinomycetota bacterium]|tara:strand:- start:440 stop:808 length:369 start_codon:yes stop_codon:yes gene_type:complete